MKTPVSRIMATFFVFLLLPAASFGAADEAAAERDWLYGFTLIELESDDVASLHEALTLIRSYGGHVAIVSPPSIMMGWVPFDVREELIGKANIKEIYYTDVLPGEIDIKDEQTRHMVTYYNRVITGEYQELVKSAHLAAPQIDPAQLRPDAFDAGEFDQGDYLENLRANGFDVPDLQKRGLLLERAPGATMGNSDYMSGTITTTLIFMESDGSLTDPNTYTWTDQHVQDYIAGVNTGLAWWSSKAGNYGDCWVAFFVRYFHPTDVRCQQWREMVLHPQSDVASSVSIIMSRFGYSLGTHITRVNSFNTAQKAAYGTDWAYTGFIAYNPPPAPSSLTDGYAAWAYRGGPYTFLLYRSFGWDVDEVFTHESGHIFWACDEYYQPGYGGCTSCGVCANGVDNGNCEYCATPVACMMYQSSFTLCPWTPGHIGWQRSPCAPTPLAPPTASTITPGTGLQGSEVEVTIVGANFLYGAFAELGAGVTTVGSDVVTPDTLRLTLAIDNTTATGVRNVVVRNRDLQSSTIVNGFEILQSTRHYASPTGGDVYPYLTAANAAAALENAIDAAGDGDTVLVESTTYTLTTLDVSKGVTMSGAWSSDFSARDVDGGKTVLDLTWNVTVNSSTGPTAFEGFLVENGTGFFDFTPVNGYYGGGFKVYNSTVRVSDCEIRQNQATSGAGFGGGGGIFATGSTVTIEDNYIHDNTATYGGGIYLHNCDGVISGNTVSGNAVSFNEVAPEGGGIHLDECFNVVLNGDTLRSNTGSQAGGGLTAKNSSNVSMSNCLVSYNQSAMQGGGMMVSSSDVDIDNVEFSRNSAVAIGGGVAAVDTSDVTLTGCKFLWNSGIVGGGFYQIYGASAVKHSLFIGNNVTSAGGGIYLASLASGEVAGNTLDRNSATNDGGGMMLTNVPVEVYNNVVVNTTGDGITCTGTLPTLGYNDVWNSSGLDYEGCSAGTGGISLEPLFVDTTLVDYHAGVHSPLIDAGRPGVSYDDPDGSPGDMGIYGSHTFVMDQPSYVAGLTAQVTEGDVLLIWNKNPEGDIDKYAVYSNTSSGFRPSASNFVAFVATPDTSIDLGAVGDTTYYRVSAVDTDQYAGGYSAELTLYPATGVGEEIVRYQNRLYQNVPNPFNPTTTVRYEIRERSRVRLLIYDVGGHLVKRLEDTTRPAGLHRVVWDGTNEKGRRISSGIYFYKLTAGGFAQTRKMVLLK